MKSERVLGGYRLGEVIGHGSMGTVYAARREDGAEAAVKVLHGHLEAEPEIATRFTREARIARQIQSPFVAGVFESGRTPDGDLWIAFERLHGESLEKRLRIEGTLRFEEVHRIVEDVLQGLLAAHAVGAVHRDIKPGNVFLERGADRSFWRARILDFGVSKMRVAAVETDHGGLTTEGDLLGSPSFMAPEQIANAAQVDGRADLYAVAVLAFQAITGVLPFEGNRTEAVLHFKRTQQALRLSAVTGIGWPAALEGWLARSLQREPGRRWDDTEAALEQWRQLKDEGDEGRENTDVPPPPSSTIA